MEEFIHAMNTLMTKLSERVKGEKNEANQRFGDQIIAYMQHNYQQDDLNLDQVAAYFEVSSSHLYAFFKTQIGISFADCLEKMRMDKACDLLSSSSLSVKEIALSIGYSSDHTFRRAFKRVIGVTPSEFVSANRSEQ